jgi:[citrate (pro-3S)-lyase] ligase
MFILIASERRNMLFFDKIKSRFSGEITQKIDDQQLTINEKKKAKLLDNVNLYNIICADGFLLSEYLKDRGLGEIYCYVNGEEWGYFSAVATSIRNNLKTTSGVSLWLSDRKNKLAFPQKLWHGFLSVKSLEDEALELKRGTHILILGSENEEINEKCKAAGLLPFQFDKFLFSALHYHYTIRVMLNKYKSVPNIKIVCCTLPTFPEGELTDNEQKIKSKTIYLSEILNDLKKGEQLEQTTLAFVDYPYTGKDIINLFKVPPSRINDAGVLRFDDFSSPYINTQDGRRINPVRAKDPQRTLFLFGGCRAMGYGAPDEKTPSALLQNAFNEHDINIEVQNWACLSNRRSRLAGKIIESTPMLPGDILLITNAFNIQELKRFEIPFAHLDLSRILDRPHNYGETIIDSSRHYTESGNQAIADAIYAGLLKEGLLENDNIETVRSEYALQQNKQKVTPAPESDLPYGKPLRDYLDTLKAQRLQIGSIVMNCNPFTLGHRYLIEYASAKVDHLYIFVVEEDKSVFKFNDRLRLVKAGTEDLGNVTVIPSGQFIISSITFSDYFGKADLQDKTIDPSFDVELFAQYIAPQLDISVRFAGEEPLDLVTKQYNDTMARILPEYGIKFDVIRRKEDDDAVISASRVRKLLEVNDWEKISQLVPKTTLDFLQNEWLRTV